LTILKDKRACVLSIAKVNFGCKGTVFSPYIQILAAKNAVYLRFLAANGIFTVIQYVKERC